MTDQVRDETFDVGDRVRIDIPDEAHPDHPHHGKNGEVIAAIPVAETADGEADQHGRQFRVALDVGGVVDVRPYFL
jgi:ribosomal protein L21E